MCVSINSLCEVAWYPLVISSKVAACDKCVPAASAKTKMAALSSSITWVLGCV